MTKLESKLLTEIEWMRALIAKSPDNVHAEPALATALRAKRYVSDALANGEVVIIDDIDAAAMIENLDTDNELLHVAQLAPAPDGGFECRNIFTPAKGTGA